MAWILRLLAHRRRQPLVAPGRLSSTHLTPKYEEARSRRLKFCIAQFKAGKVGAHFEPLAPNVNGERS